LRLEFQLSPNDAISPPSKIVYGSTRNAAHKERSDSEATLYAALEKVFFGMLTRFFLKRNGLTLTPLGVLPQAAGVNHL